MTSEFPVALFTADHNAAAFLAAMLEGVETEEGYFSSVGMAVDGKNPAFVLRPVLENGVGRQRMFHARGFYTPSAAEEKSFTVLVV